MPPPNAKAAPRVRPLDPAGTLYSQCGEDAVIIEAFADKRTGFFVEIGCIDGWRFSNTLALERLGWDGLCVEAHPGYIDALRANRPSSRVVHAAAGDVDRKGVAFFQNARGSLSTLDASLEAEYAERFGAFFSGFDETTVPMRSLTSMLDELGGRTPNVVSIDAEGCDHLVVRGLDLDRYRPDLVLVEADEPGQAEEIRRAFEDAGYQPPLTMQANHFFFLEQARAERAARPIEAEVLHTEHPCDDTGDARHRVRVQLRAA